MRYDLYKGEIDYAQNKYNPVGIRVENPDGTVEVFSPRKNHFCKDCVTYYKNLHKQGLTQKEFPLVCKFDRRLAQSAITRDMFASDEEFELAFASLDPVTWGSVFLDFKARWYQEEELCCSSQFKVLRAGRRVGKSEAIALLALWSAFTKKNYRILLICPYESQVELLFAKIRNLIGKSAIVSESAKIKQSPPQEITFNNGSMIIGFSAGAKSSARSDKIRGQGANLIIFDEADYLADSDVETVMAVLADQPDTNVVFSSTPTGTRRQFFRNCTDKDGRYKEFHYISAESPTWTATAEYELRSKYSDGGYLREFNAEFGTELEGVFKAGDIDKCLKNYAYSDLHPSDYRDWKIAMGVDWNKITGTHLVVVGVDPASKKSYVLDKQIIKRQEFTQHAGVEAVRLMDIKWNCDWVYVDVGYGSVQIEMLQKMDEYKGTSFKKKLKGIELGGNTEIISPATHLPEKKPTKGLAVNIAVKVVERNLLLMPESEDTSKQIIETEIPYLDIGIAQQMRNFKEEKVSPSGRITYSDDYEHTLTALILALFAIAMNVEDYNKVKHDNTFGCVSPIRMGTPIPTHDVTGKPLPPSMVAMLREQAERDAKEQTEEMMERLNKLRNSNPRSLSGDKIAQANSKGEILVAKNGITVRESIGAITGRRFVGSRTGGRSFRRRHDRSR